MKNVLVLCVVFAFGCVKQEPFDTRKHFLDHYFFVTYNKNGKEHIDLETKIGRDIVHRKIIDEDSVQHGPMAGRMQHGRWAFKRHKDPPEETEYHYFWLGKHVSQAEFEKLSK
jgi:hypothetical protein